MEEPQNCKSMSHQVTETSRPKTLPHQPSIEFGESSTSLEEEAVTACMKPLPADTTAFLLEVNSLGLMGPKPTLEKPRAKLIDYINNSRQIGRSINHVSILLVGESGVGKSATINHLLALFAKDSFEFAKTSECQSETRSSQEFIIYGDEPRYEVKDLPLGVVDTPGFNDTGGSHQDACNLWSIKQFFQTHPKLSGHYPNLIFLIIKATDTRFKGDNSELAKSLRCVKQLKLVDPNNPNVLAILTHACGIPYKKVVTWSEKLETKKAAVKKIIHEALKVSAPVVVMENLYGEEDYDLDVVDDYTRLPNGVLQPRNLYEACADVLKKNEDHFGLITLNSVFAASTKVTPKRGHNIEAKNAKTCTLDVEERDFFHLMEEASRGGACDPIDHGVKQYIQGKKGLKVQEKNELWKIAATLRKPGVGDSHNLGYIEYSLGREISSTGREMLQKQFEITMEPRSNKVFESGRIVGEGYNLLNDKSAATQVFNFVGTKTQYGIVIPECARFEKVEVSKTFMEQFETDKSYTESRLKNLNVSIEFKPNMCMASYRAGCNKAVDSTSSSSTSKFSFLFEERMFQIKIGNYKEYLKDRTVTFTEDFTSDVENLPKSYDKSDSSCRSDFERFFGRFGHFLVSSAYGGGSVEVTFSNDMVGSTTESLAKAQACLLATFKGLDIGGAEFEAAANFAKVVDAKALLAQCVDNWEGGDMMLRDKATIGNKEKMQKWKASLLVNPTMLTSELTLEPISTAVACLDRIKGKVTYVALKDILGSDFKLLSDREKSKEEENRNEMEKTKRSNTVQNPPKSKRNCFPSSSVVNVRTKDGVAKQKKMVNLEVGDKVMGWDEKRNQPVFTKVIMFAHRASDAMNVEYLKIALEDGNKITLSGNHLVMVGKRKKAVLAQNVKVGEILFTVDENWEISPEKVLAIERVIGQGVYCPITVHGNLIVDNVLASCYASVQDHVFLEGLVNIPAQSIAHFGLMPMRALRKLRLKWLRKIPNGQTIHPYLQWLCKLNLPFMAN